LRVTNYLTLWSLANQFRHRCPGAMAFSALWVIARASEEQIVAYLLEKLESFGAVHSPNHADARPFGLRSGDQDHDTSTSLAQYLPSRVPDSTTLLAMWQLASNLGSPKTCLAW